MTSFDSRIVEPTARAIHQAAAALLAGRLVAFPTETVYGLGGDAANPDAIRAVFAAKHRPADHPVIVHLAGSADLAHWVREIPPGARALADAFWPGPLTLILPRAAHVSDLITGGQDSVGIRVPSHPVALALLRSFQSQGGLGVAAPSANRFGHVSPTQARHVAEDLGDAVTMILDGGISDVGIESTIVAFTGEHPMLLRPGGVSVEAIGAVLGCMPLAPSTGAPRASGTLASHYATRTRAFVFEPAALGVEIAQRRQRDERVAVLARTVDRPAGFEGRWLQAPRAPSAYAHDMYANLRELDRADADAILIETLPATHEWLAVVDRVTRATHGTVDDRD